MFFCRESLAPYLNPELSQMDVRTPLLNGNLQEAIYMDQPIGFVSNGQEN